MTCLCDFENVQCAHMIKLLRPFFDTDIFNPYNRNIILGLGTSAVICFFFFNEFLTDDGRANEHRVVTCFGRVPFENFSVDICL